MKIVSIQQRPSGLFIVTDDHGTRYATSSQYLATLAQRAMELDKPVAILSFRGWYYRNLHEITILESREMLA